MATLNIAMKIVGGAAFNTPTTAGNTTIISTGPGEYADVSMKASVVASNPFFPGVLEIVVGGVSLARLSAADSEVSLGDTDSRVDNPSTSTTETIVNRVDGEMMHFRVPPNSSLVVTRTNTSGVASTYMAKGVYTIIGNSQ